MREWWSRIRRVIRRTDPADELHEEIEANLSLHAQDLAASGVTPEQAHFAAKREFGNVTRTLESSREAWTFSVVESFLQDARYALRAIRRSPGYFAVIIVTLALGLGATSAIFSVLYSVLLRPLPYPHGERLVRMSEATSKAEGISVTWINFEHWRDDNHSFEDMAAYDMAHFSLTGRGEPLFTRAGIVTSSFFRITGARPILGRVFGTTDDRSGAARAIVLSYTFWSDRFGGDPHVLGTTLNLNGEPAQVIGVLAPGPRFFPKPIDLYLPLASFEGQTVNRAKHGSIRAIGRLKPGVSLRTAIADLNLIMKHLAQVDPGPENDHRAYGQFLAEFTTHEIRPTLLILFGCAAMVLLIAGANVAGLMLARSTQRVREMAIRTSIGAGRARLNRQVLTENLVCAALGGAAGLMIAYGGVRVLIRQAPPDIPRLSEVGLDSHVFLFAAALTLLTGLFVGFAPVLFGSRFHLAAALNNDSRSATSSRGSQSLRSALVIGEIAITLVLTFAAGLLLRSLLRAATADPGFDPNHLLALELVLPSGSYKTSESIRTFYEQLVRETRGIPGVSDTGAVVCPPSAGDCGDWFYSVVGAPVPQRGDVPVSLFNTADPDYFRTMRIPIRQGRPFSGADREGRPSVVIVNETFARKWWPGGAATGHYIKSGGPYMPGPLYQIVGVAGDVSQMGLDADPLPEIYVPFAQKPSEAMVVMMRTASKPENIMATVRRRVAKLDPMLPIQSMRPFAEEIGATLDRRRFITLLVGVFALLATALSAVGIYGLISYWVSVREQDIAIRLALGAQRSAILQLVGAHALRLTIAGVAIGVLCAAWASSWIASLLFNTTPDPAAASVSVAAMGAFCLCVAAVPIFRATRVNVLEKLRRG